MEGGMGRSDKAAISVAMPQAYSSIPIGPAVTIAHTNSQQSAPQSR
jgi:hypothetical protein